MPTKQNLVSQSVRTHGQPPKKKTTWTPTLTRYLPQEHVNVDRDLIPDLGAVGGKTACEVARLGRVEEPDLLLDQRLEQPLPHSHVDPRPDDGENASPGVGDPKKPQEIQKYKEEVVKMHPLV